MAETTDLVTTDDRQLDLFEKSHGDAMSMTEFVTWFQDNVGGQTMKDALQNAALMLCGDVIAQDISKASLRLREWLENDTSKVVSPRKHELAGFLGLDANRRHTWRSAIEMMVYWSCFTDNAYAGIIRAQDGTPLEIIPFQTGRVQEKVEGRDVFYDVFASTMQEQALLGAPTMTFHERDMIHVRTRLLDGMEGYSTLDAGKRTIEVSNNIAEYIKNLFDGDGQIRGVFSRENAEPLPDLIFQRIRQQFGELMSRFRRSMNPIVLEGGVKFVPISSKPDEMELTKQFEASVNEVCRLFRMPPHKIFLMNGAKYENLETMEKMYVGDTLIPRAEAFESEFAKKLLGGRKERLKYFLQFDRAEMTLRDTKAETERTIRALERGGITFDEARAVFGYNPLPNGAGSCRIIPANMVVVDENNKVVIMASAAGGLDKPHDEKPADDTGDQPEKTAPQLRLISND